ncbi:MAG: NAD(+)/NADH kinase [Vampirovibrionales bacterium]|nr:NAD(+)/NADH kinase [Vampirovibrionales bacterium]
MISNVVVVHNPLADAQGQALKETQALLSQHGVSFEVVTTHPEACPRWPAHLDAPGAERNSLLLVLGGDGTLLRMAQCMAQFASRPVPMVGVNTGHLGFLTRIEFKRLAEAIPRLLSGAFSLEHRAMLQLQLQNHSGQEQPPPLLHAVNDVVIKNTNPSQLAQLNLYIDDQFIARTDADGLIIASPTGSTAYTLAAGGPIIAPNVEAMAITPICPHSFTAKPIVVSSRLRVRVESVPKSPEGRVVIAVDGQDAGVLAAQESVVVSMAQAHLPLVTFDAPPDYGFFNVLHQKLHWATNPRK